MATELKSSLARMEKIVGSVALADYRLEPSHRQLDSGWLRDAEFRAKSRVYYGVASVGMAENASGSKAIANYPAPYRPLPLHPPDPPPPPPKTPPPPGSLCAHWAGDRYGALNFSQDGCGHRVKKALC